MNRLQYQKRMWLLILLCTLVVFLFPLREAVAHQMLEGSQERNGTVVFQQKPFVLDGNTYVPLRELAEYLKLGLMWDVEERQLILNDGQVAFSFKTLPEQPGSGIFAPLEGKAEQLGVKKQMDEVVLPYHTEKGRLFFPLRHLAQYFEWNLIWDSHQKEVSLTANVSRGEPISLCFSVTEPYSRMLWPTPQRIAYLTFDDGPSKKVTPYILDILSEENIKGTFFVVGEQIKRNPEILRRINEEGHSIGNHTYTHRREILYSGVGPFMQEIRATEELIHAVIGERPKIFRMPYGTNFANWPAYRRALNTSGYTHVSWNVNSMDATAINVPAERIVAEVKRQVSGKDNVIILFHDLVSVSTAEALPEIIRYLKSLGYFIWPL